MAWPDNTVKRKPSNLAALKLLEEGYVIVSKYDVPADVVPYGQYEYPEPFTPTPGVTGDVLKRIDNQQFGIGHKNWLPDEGAGATITDAPDDGRIYSRQSKAWVTIDDTQGINYLQDWTINAGDIVGATYNLHIPAPNLPKPPFKYMAGFLLTNVGKAPVPKIDIQYRIAIEESLGVFVNTAGVSFDTTILSTPNCIAPVYVGDPGTYRIYNYVGGGINLVISCTSKSEDFTTPQVVGLAFTGKIMWFG